MQDANPNPKPTVLLMERDRAIRTEKSLWLIRRGYIVFECASSQQAVAIMKVHGQVIEHVISDFERFLIEMNDPAMQSFTD